MSYLGAGGMQLNNRMTPSGILYPTYQQAAAFQQQQQQLAQQQQHQQQQHAYYYQQMAQQPHNPYSPTSQLGVVPSYPVGASMLTNNQLHGMGLKPIVNNPAGAMPGGWVAMQQSHGQPQQPQAQSLSAAAPMVVKSSDDDPASGSVVHGHGAGLQVQHPSLMSRSPFVQQPQAQQPQMAAAQLQYPFYPHPQMGYAGLSPTGTGATAASAAGFAPYPINVMQQQQVAHAPMPTAAGAAAAQPPQAQAQG